MNPTLLHLLKALYFVKIALLPGLAVVGYFIVTSGWRWLDASQGVQNAALGLPLVNPLWAVFSAVVMLFVSVFCFVVLNVARAPSSPIFLLLSVLQLPLILILFHLLPGAEVSFWRTSISALLVEMNALLLAVVAMKLLVPDQALSGSEGGVDSSEVILVCYLIAALLLLNFTTYGMLFWRDTLALTAPKQGVIFAVIAVAASFYFHAFRHPDGNAGEATRVIGAEMISGIVLIPTWGVLIFVYPLCPVVGIFVAAFEAARK